MTYARARLWLGITGVGSLVSISLFALVTELPQRLSQTRTEFGSLGLSQLVIVTSLFLIWLMPLDFLGGFAFPRRFEKSKKSFRNWVQAYLVAATAQALLFVLFGSLIVWTSQIYGRTGGLAAITISMISCFVVRNRLLLRREFKSANSNEKLVNATAMIQSWQIFVPRTVVVEHTDIGFTGGIIGFGKRAQIVIPRAWLSLTREQLATSIARRALAVSTGSYHRGLAIAFAWNLSGFLLCSFLPGASLESVAGLVTTLCGFTLWSFLGLLTLPTISRNACLTIDRSLSTKGVPLDLISNTAHSIDQMQDDEPDRPRWIETIFHPVPNVSSRNPSNSVRGLEAWNVARSTLFLSWACLGFLSRSVHCNLGRPELWTMLPTD